MFLRVEKMFTKLAKLQVALKWVGTSRRLWRTAFALLLVYGVMSPSTYISAPRVVDNANIMDDSEEQTLRNTLNAISSGLEIQYIVVTSAEVSPERVTLAGNDALGLLRGDRSWLAETLVPSAGNGVVLFYSVEPPLLQVRYGRTINPRALHAGIAYGDAYAAIQTAGVGPGGEPRFSAAAEMIGKHLSNASNLDVVREMTTHLLLFFDSEVLQMLLVPDFEIWGEVSRRFAVPVVEWLGGILPNAFVFLLLFGCSTPLVRVALMLLSAAPAMLIISRGDPFSMFGTISMILSMLVIVGGQIALVLLVLYPALGLILLGASGRAEDLMMLQALGLDVSKIPEFPQRLSLLVLLALATLMFALRYVRFLADDYAATKRKYAKAIERLQKMGIEEQHLSQLSDQAREKIETEYAESRPKLRRQAVAKGAVGVGLMWLFPAWLAISVAAFTLAYELVPIRFRSPD